MLWMMASCLLLGVLLFAGGRSFSGGYLAPLLIGVFVTAHIWMMLKGHGGHGDRNDTNTEDKIAGTSAKQPETKDDNDKHKHGGCCH